ncbi:peptidase M23 [Dactylosporangium sp. CA-092794]|uniref:peptidase M23 n=1 Tax=Dactylosporangium sp. CA-092794 TaxID=3239929 RepID=UPI003D8CB395
MHDSADEKPQLSDGANGKPRHLRLRRFRHATHWLVAFLPPRRLIRAARGLAAQTGRFKAAVPNRLGSALPARLTSALPSRLGAALPSRLGATLPSRLGAMPAGARQGAVAALVVAMAAFGLSTTLSTPAGRGGPAGSGSALVADADRASTGPASRDYDRAKRATDPATRSSKAPAPAASSPAPAAKPPVPVGGLTQAEMDNAAAIVDVARHERLPAKAAVIAVSTALQESHLRNLANANLPASLQHPNEGVGYDYDSVGLFQQRPSWGSVDQLMNPHESARRFYAALLSIPGWGDYAVTVAAQMVQRSAFPDAYAKWQGLAEQIVDQLL